ncbi:hypothetical protein ACH5RR_002590 [Cinchona calisaya]|uniref:Secreted protein n=1 Tax=Cinchona calisaya TaxID=153742 RepID=A0ABD3ASJ3_9GENT
MLMSKLVTLTGVLWAHDPLRLGMLAGNEAQTPSTIQGGLEMPMATRGTLRTPQMCKFKNSNSQVESRFWNLSTMVNGDETNTDSINNNAICRP